MAGSKYVLGAAAEALGRIGSTRAVETLIASLKDSNYCLREASAEVLGETGDARAVEPLLAVLEDWWKSATDIFIWKVAVKALGKIGDARAAEPLVALLKDGKKYMFRKDVALALGDIGDARAVEPLIMALTYHYEQWFSSEKAKAAEVLGKFGDTQVIEPLVAALKGDHPNVPTMAAKVLRQIQDAHAE